MVHSGRPAESENLLVPTSHDAPALWAISAFLGAYIGLCIAFGKAPSRGYWLRRSENPGVFWAVMGLAGIGLFVLVFLSLYASMPWPDHQ